MKASDGSVWLYYTLTDVEDRRRHVFTHRNTTPEGHAAMQKALKASGRLVSVKA